MASVKFTSSIPCWCCRRNGKGEIRKGRCADCQTGFSTTSGSRRAGDNRSRSIASDNRDCSTDAILLVVISACEVDYPHWEDSHRGRETTQAISKCSQWMVWAITSAPHSSKAIVFGAGNLSCCEVGCNSERRVEEDERRELHLCLQ